MAHPRVLVVEDDALIRIEAADVLEQAGFRTIEAATGDQALGLLERDGIDVLYTDVDLGSRPDGLTLAHLVHERWPEIGLMLTSGHVFFGDSRLPPGALFCPKPCLPDDIVDGVRQVLQRRSGERQNRQRRLGGADA